MKGNKSSDEHQIAIEEMKKLFQIEDKCWISTKLAVHLVLRKTHVLLNKSSFFPLKSEEFLTLGTKTSRNFYLGAGIN